MDETLITFGGEVKALDDEGRVGGYLVRFTSAKDPDISPLKDYFQADTDFDLERSTKCTVYFDHGLDSVLKRRKLSLGEMKIDSTGIWIEAVLARRDSYEKAIYELARQNKLGWSSGRATPSATSSACAASTTRATRRIRARASTSSRAA